MTPEAFRAARKQLGLSQAQAADMLGYGSKPRVSEIERGLSNPGASVVRLLQAYLDGYRPHDWPVDETNRMALDEVARLTGSR